MPSPSGVRIGQVLVKKGYITDIQLISALEEQKRTKEFLGQIIIRRGYLSEEQLAHAIAERFSMSFVDLRGEYIDWQMSGQLDPSFISDHQCLPLRVEDDVLIVATVNPLDVQVRSRIEQSTRAVRVRWVVVTSSAMQEALRVHHHKVMERVRKKIRNPKPNGDYRG